MCEDTVRDELTQLLDWHPALVRSSDISRVQRNRYVWFSERLVSHPGFEVEKGASFDSVFLSGPLEPLDLILEPGWEWPAAEQSEVARIPTLTRAIRRKNPPVEPRGLERLGAVEALRWKQDGHRFPPYAYADAACFQLPGQPRSRRPPVANEREVLMGFPRGHTLGMDPKALEEDLEDQRCSAVGNSFHVGVFACLFAAVLFQVGFVDRYVSPTHVALAFHMTLRAPEEIAQEVEEQHSSSDSEERALPARQAQPVAADRSGHFEGGQGEPGCREFIYSDTARVVSGFSAEYFLLETFMR